MTPLASQKTVRESQTNRKGSASGRGGNIVKPYMVRSDSIGSASRISGL